MAKTIVGLFDTFDQAQRVVDDLTSAGVDRSNISLVHRNRDDATAINTGDTTTADAVGAGAIGGGVLGGTLGLLVGIGALVIPGIGPVIAAGPLAAALGSAAVGAGIGAAAGGLIGALVGAGVPEEEAHVYAEGVRRGGTLVTVNADDMMADRVYSIMRGAGAADINTKAAGWRSEGWSRFDERAEPYPLSDIDDNWERSSKVGTTGGAVAGAATGAVMGSAAGPVGTVIGGAAGAAVGAGVGAAGDAAGEALEDNVEASRAVGDGNWSTYEPTFRSDYTSPMPTAATPGISIPQPTATATTRPPTSAIKAAAGTTSRRPCGAAGTRAATAPGTASRMLYSMRGSGPRTR